MGKKGFFFNLNTIKMKLRISMFSLLISIFLLVFINYKFISSIRGLNNWTQYSLSGTSDVDNLKFYFLVIVSKGTLFNKEAILSDMNDVIARVDARYVTLINGNVEQNIPKIENKQILAVLQDTQVFWNETIRIKLSKISNKDKNLINETDQYIMLLDNFKEALELELILNKKAIEQMVAKFKLFQLLFSVLVSLVFAITLFITGRLTRRINNLNKTLGRIIKGEFNLRIRVVGKDEITDLASKFNTMLDTLNNEKARSVQASKMATVGEMTAKIAHEINNPLAIISASVTRIFRTMVKEGIHSEKTTTYLHDIYNTVKRIITIMDSLKSIVRDSRSDPYEYVRVRDIVTETISICENRCNSQTIVLKADKIDKDVYVECRPIEISQILINLIANACDAIEELEDKWIKLEVHDFHQSVKIIIQDSGHGIPIEVADKIMSPFFTTKKRGKGTGLGLSIARNIMVGHKGTLSIDADNEHTTFVIILPKKHGQRNIISDDRMTNQEQKNDKEHAR